MISKVKTLLTKMFKQNKKVVVKSLMVLLLSGILLPQGVFVGEVVAQSSDNQNTTAGKSAEQEQRKSIISMTTFMETISKVSYVLLWPLVALAGLAMDNSLVYGSFIGFDVSLWKIWQIVRTFANYTLGVLFLVGILIFNFSPSGKVFGTAVKSRKDLIVKTLIASVLIQASWFIMMALVDLSTILTYTVGSLPTLVINADEKQDSRMLQQFTLLNLGNSTASANADIGDAIIGYWGATTGDKTTYVAPCEVYSKLNQSFIIGRKFDSLTGRDNSGKESLLNMAPGYCVYFGKLISFRDFDGDTRIANTYKERLQTFKNDMSSASGEVLTQLVSGGIILPISSGKLGYLSGELVSGKVNVKNHDYGSDTIGCDNDAHKVGAVPSVMSGDAFQCLYTKSNVSLNNLIKKSTTMVGPFSALYSNLSTFSSFDVSQGLGIWQKFIVMLVNIVFSILLVLPLGALVIVLFARIGILWFVIGLSPFIVLINVFEGLFKVDLPVNVKYKDIFAVLIAPVLISFAVSLALVFMTTLKNAVGPGFGSSTETATVEGKDVIKNISGMEYDGSNLSLLGFIKIKLDNVILNVSWLILMIFGLGVTWFLLFRAIKASGSVGKKVGTMFESIGETAVKNMPIIPINGGALTFQSLQDAPGLINQKLSSATNASEENLRNLFRKQGFLDAGQSKGFMEYYNFNSGSDAKDVFSKLSEVQSQERWGIYSKQNDVKDAIQNYMKGKKDIPETYLGKKWKFGDKTYTIKKGSEENPGYQFVEDVPTGSPQGTSPGATPPEAPQQS